MFGLYEKIRSDFKDLPELVSYNISKTMWSINLLEQSAKILKLKTDNKVLQKRRENELHFYNFLEHQLFSRLQEIKYYSKVDVQDTRRLVAVSSDCISMIQILIRDVIHLNVHFRSSDFDGALPCDLEFISRLPRVFIEHLQKMKQNPGYEEVNDKLIENLLDKPIQLNLMFGSLHRTLNT